MMDYWVNWEEWQKSDQWWPQNQPWTVCPSCGQSYQGWTHVCSNITPYNPTITIGGYSWPVETKMDKIKVVTKISGALGVLSSSEAMGEFLKDKPKEYRMWHDAIVEQAITLLEEALEEMISD